MKTVIPAPPGLQALPSGGQRPLLVVGWLLDDEEPGARLLLADMGNGQLQETRDAIRLLAPAAPPPPPPS